MASKAPLNELKRSSITQTSGSLLPQDEIGVEQTVTCGVMVLLFSQLDVAVAFLGTSSELSFRSSS